MLGYVGLSPSPTIDGATLSADVCDITLLRTHVYPKAIALAIPRKPLIFKHQYRLV